MARRKRTEASEIPESMQHFWVEKYMAQGMTFEEAITEHVWSMPRPVWERLGRPDHPTAIRHAMWREVYPKKEA